MARDAIIVGRQPIREALRAQRPISKLMFQEGYIEGSIREILALAKESRIPTFEVPKIRLDTLSEGIPHQGVAAFVSPKATLTMDDLEGLLEPLTESPFFFVLDGIQDPHNLGAIVRVANACGVHAIIIPERGAVGITATVAKASAGAIEYVPIIKAINLSQAVEQLKNAGIFVYGADPEHAVNYTKVDYTGPLAIVIGAEGSGIRPLVKAHCDGLVQLPMQGQVSSLNASTAAAVLGFEVVRQRHLK